jgi:hypothetical protein
LNRRGFMALAGSFAVAWPPTAGAQQQSTLPRIAYLSLGPGPTPRVDGLLQGLHELGYAESVNIIIEYRWSDGDLDKAKEQADELATSKVAVIVTGGPTATLIARKATATIAIVMANDQNAIGSGFVSTLARPGSNITDYLGKPFIMEELIARAHAVIRRSKGFAARRIAKLHRIGLHCHSYSFGAGVPIFPIMPTEGHSERRGPNAHCSATERAGQKWAVQ